MDSRSTTARELSGADKEEVRDVASQREKWVASLAHRICERRLSVPAIFFFESLRPLNFIASQTLHALAPLASLFVEPSQWEEFATALGERQTIDRLLEEIEKREREQSLGR